MKLDWMLLSVLPSIGILSFYFSVHILLKFLHIEQLDRFVQFQGSVGNLDNLIGNRIFTVRNFHEHICFGNPFDQDVATVVHLNLTALRYVKISLEV